MTQNTTTTAPAQNAGAITPNDSTDLFRPTRGLYVGASGDVKVTFVGGSQATFVGLAPGVIHPFAVERVWATGTTATNIIGVW